MQPLMKTLVRIGFGCTGVQPYTDNEHFTSYIFAE